MTATQGRAADIHAFAVLAELEIYEERVENVLLHPCPALDRLEVRGHLARMRRSCAASGDFTVPWLALMISHFELLACADARGGQPAAVSEARLQEALARHDDCVRQLAAACRRLLRHQAPVPAAESVRQRGARLGGDRQPEQRAP